MSYIADYDPGIPKVASDGIFGAGTRNAVVAFQRNYGLTADGIVGQATWNRLCEVSTQIATGTASDQYPGTPLRVGSSGANVLKMQRYLNYIANTYTNIPRVATDGIFGNATRSAVVAFQRQFGLTADGIIGQQTWNRIVQVYNDLRVQAASQQDQPSVMAWNDSVSSGTSVPYEGQADSAVPAVGADVQIRQLRKQLQDLLRAHPELSADRRAWRDDPMMEAGLFEQNGMPRRDETL